MKHLILGALLSMAATVPSFAQTPASKPVSIVLVHGAFVDGSGWKAVYDILTRDGYEVLVVQNSTATLDGDVETTREVIRKAGKAGHFGRPLVWRRRHHRGRKRS